MIAWFALSVTLLLWNAIYCALKVAKDLRGSRPADGVWGLFALAGSLSILIMIAFYFFARSSGV